MTIQELEKQLLGLDPVERQRLADLLNQSLVSGQSLSIGSTMTWNDPGSLNIANSSKSWDVALKKLQAPISPQALTDLLQSWEDEGDEQEQKETWAFLQQALDRDRLSDRALFP